MKKALLFSFSLILSACSSVQNTQSTFIDPYPQITSIQDLPQEHRYKPKQCSPKFDKNGELDEVVSNGRRIKAKIKNHCIDEEVFIYHQNGQLHSNTPLVNGLAEGWSNGYTMDGVLRTRILYQKGETKLIQVYHNGQLVKEIK
ncbi:MULTISPECIES: hypothetical protein [Glaesserella]|uniref:Toxin-antitoxin system YwqK family antitoxin n=1 Tax=Glaesserella australis TaxID=2094024 RepID=A0A328C2Y5_9PAST|nr:MULTISPECIES: hypothetical protein [Glaesserella]AUI66366.1 hypothetical protein CJD39_07125 [Glaesserella sp. 15-184]RAL19420.1 hypothetical protein C5N92_02945 [Glaesserella australis]